MRNSRRELSTLRPINLTPDLETRFWAKVCKSSGCWEWTAYRNKCGYGLIGAPKSRATYLAHRVSYRIATGCDPGMNLVLHRCDNPACVNPEHLFIGTDADNTADCVLKGRKIILRGSRHPNALLTDEQVAFIRASSLPASDLAHSLGVSRSAIYNVRGGFSWSGSKRPRKNRKSRLCGENNPRHKLTAGEVRQIRALSMTGVAKRELARRFGVSDTVVCKIVSGTAWRTHDELAWEVGR